MLVKSEGKMGKDAAESNKKWTTGPPPMDPNKLYVNQQEEDQMEIQGYVSSPLLTVVVWFFIFITAGLLRLVFHWVPQWYLRVTHRKCSLAEATSVLLKDQYQQWFVARVQTITKDGTQVEVVKPRTVSFSLSASSRRRQARLLLNTGQDAVQPKKARRFKTMAVRDENLIRYFVVKKVKYLWDPDGDRYQKLKGLEVNNSCSYFHEAKGLSQAHQAKRRVLYGINSIAVHVTPIIVLLFKEVLTPFYVFQVFSMCVWYADEYYYYASCIILITVISISATVYQTRKY